MDPRNRSSVFYFPANGMVRGYAQQIYAANLPFPLWSTRDYRFFFPPIKQDVAQYAQNFIPNLGSLCSTNFIATTCSSFNPEFWPSGSFCPWNGPRFGLPGKYYPRKSGPIYMKCATKERRPAVFGPEIDQYDIRSLVSKLSEAKCQVSTPDGICNEIVNEMNSLKLSHPNDCVLRHFRGPFNGQASPADIFAQQFGKADSSPVYSPSTEVKSENHDENVHMLRYQPKLHLKQYNDEVLFFIFYYLTRDELQLSAAAVLFEKGWRYHLELKIWMSRNPNSLYKPVQGRRNYLVEHGIYNWFDVKTWKTLQTQMTCDFSKLDYSLVFISANKHGFAQD